MNGSVCTQGDMKFLQQQAVRVLEFIDLKVKECWMNVDGSVFGTVGGEFVKSLKARI